MHYDNLFIFEDLNYEVYESCLNSICKVNKLKNLVESPTCFKYPSSPSCIDLLLTNCLSCFAETPTFETGISDFHKMVVTILKINYKKQKAMIIQYRNCIDFADEAFKLELNKLFEIDLNKR